ncbi:Conjugative transposon protein TraI [Sphingobacterium faecium PCAi_F2.5]|nr:Conjugative transposon protein TraI [Sphingobacterium faecium PCAi_F2.5]
MLLVCTAIMLAVTPSAKAQFVVTDPANLASGILNSANEIVQTSSTVSNVVKNFKEVEKVYKQGKEYYDKLKAINNLVKDARKVQQTVLLVGDVSEMYVQNFGKMMNDPNFTAQELTAIGNGYSALLGESTELLKELKQIITSSSLSLNDKERMDIIDRVYKEVKEYHSLVRYYTNKNISVSYLRAKKKDDAKRVLDLYGTSNQKYW